MKQAQFVEFDHVFMQAKAAQILAPENNNCPTASFQVEGCRP